MKKVKHFWAMVGVCIAIIGFILARPLIRPLIYRKRASSEKEDKS